MEMNYFLTAGIVSALFMLIIKLIRSNNKSHTRILDELRNMDDREFLMNVPVNLKRAASKGKLHFSTYQNALEIVFNEKFRSKAEDKKS